MSQKETVTVQAECKECEGTGLYKGWTCHDGAAMVCRNCGGTGKVEITYVPFTSRKKLEGITRVFQAMSWRHFYPTAHTFEDTGVTVNYDQYGCTLEEWENGKEPIPMPEK